MYVDDAYAQPSTRLDDIGFTQVGLSRATRLKTEPTLLHSGLCDVTIKQLMVLLR